MTRSSSAQLPAQLEQRLLRLAEALVDQQAAQVVVPPMDSSTGFWFGGGNVVTHPVDGFYLVGRYRNHGDSRTGLALGARGLELALFHSPPVAAEEPLSFSKVLSWSKADLSVGEWDVLSIEGAALHWADGQWELFVSTEKQGLGYPDDLQTHQKPGSGVWTIDRLTGESLDSLRNAAPQQVIAGEEPGHLHVKDPNVHVAANGSLQLVYCTHPFSWSSSNTAFMTRSTSGDWSAPTTDAIQRGATWDVAMTRVTCVVDVPAWGELASHRVSLVFYDGGESLRQLDEHSAAVRRPRGYSCEELGGVGYIVNDDLHSFRRLSTCFPAFVSPYGTGCSRYVQSVWDADRGYVTTWQQSQPDFSQPLVLHEVAPREVAQLLGD